MNRCASDSGGADSVRHALGQVGVSARLEDVLLAVRLNFKLAIEDIDKSLGRSGWERTAGNELRGHLREARA